ncbi:hypothetical protein CLOM_g23837, partial [Closterium sp. NIES-68]
MKPPLLCHIFQPAQPGSQPSLLLPQRLSMLLPRLVQLVMPQFQQLPRPSRQRRRTSKRMRMRRSSCLQLIPPLVPGSLSEPLALRQTAGWICFTARKAGRCQGSNDDVRLRNTQLEEEALASRDELQRQTVVTTTSLRAVENLANHMEKKVLTDKRVNDIMKQAVSLTISKPPYINYAPDEAHWLNLFVELANVQPLSETAFKLKLELSNSDALERTGQNVQQQVWEKASNLRLGALLNSPLKLIKAVINSDGKKCYKKDTEFALACVKWVAENAIDDTGIPWHEWLGVPFSSPAFLAVGKVWTGKAGPVVALHRHQLTLTMAV